MSQVIFKTTAVGKDGVPRDVRVQGGWDGPDHDFYLIVTDARDDETLYWSDEDPAHGARGTGLLKRRLAALGVEAPHGFWERVEVEDSEGIYMHRADGTWDNWAVLRSHLGGGN